jgi:hypothetical protein
MDLQPDLQHTLGTDWMQLGVGLHSSFGMLARGTRRRGMVSVWAGGGEELRELV